MDKEISWEEFFGAGFFDGRICSENQRQNRDEKHSCNAAAPVLFLPLVTTWEEWSHIFTDIAVWEPAIREICRKEGITVTTVQPGFPGTNAVFLLDDKMVIKIAPPQCHDEIRNELDIGRALGNRVPVPKVLFAGVFHDRIDWPWFVMEYKPGLAAREIRNRMEREDWLEICRKTGEIVREIHATPLSELQTVRACKEITCSMDFKKQWLNSPFFFEKEQVIPLLRLNATLAGWTTFVENRRADSIKALTDAGVPKSEVLAEILAFFADFPFAEDSPLVLVNADLTEDHLLLVEQNGHWHISALIDLADGQVAPVPYEWPALWFGLLGKDKESFSSFLRGYHQEFTAKADFRRVLLAYTLLHRFCRNSVLEVLKEQGTDPLFSFEDLLEILYWKDSDSVLAGK